MPSKTQEDLATQLDAGLLKRLKEAETKGDVVEYAKLASVVRARLKDCGITAVQGAKSPIDELRGEMEKRGMKFKGQPIPPLDTETRDAATGTKG